tara:strand:+ start:386 stop:1261 length:876 start_codon:yes stop_codon:yes gene_type:complete
MVSSNKNNGKKKITEIKTFSVPFDLNEKKEIITITTNTNAPLKQPKEQIINQAFKFHSQGNISEAAKYYQCFLDQGFKDHRVFSNYAIILINLGKLKEAELLLRKAIELKPDFTEAYCNLGNILKSLGKLEEAELSTRKAIELKPNFAQAHSNLGTILKCFGKLKEAELSIRKAIEIDPNYAEAHYNLGNMLRALGQLKEAELSIRKTIELKPNFADAHYVLGIVSSALGKIDEAILNFERSLTIKPTMSEAIVGLGQSLLVKGQYIKALNLIKKGDGNISFDLEHGVSIY